MLIAMSGINQKSSNPFAIALLYYHLYVRSKLSSDLLSKVAKKYKRSSAALLSDLGKKYEFSMPDSVNICEIQRLVGAYKVPLDYIALLDQVSANSNYSAAVDIYSDKFDAETALASGTLFAPDLSVLAHDNMARVAYLLPNYEGPVSRVRSIPSSSSSSSNTNTTMMISGDPIKGGNDNEVQVVKRNCFDNIAELSSGAFHSHDVEGNAVHHDSPLRLLYSCMKDNIRVRIIIRRKGCVRGSLDCYVKAFDKHFNMILRDVDEEYITNQQASRTVVMGRFKNRHNITQRHLPQLLLRGDNVVMVYRLPSSGTSSSSSVPRNLKI